MRREIGLWVCLTSVAQAGEVGWRHDGTGTFSEAEAPSPPLAWDAAKATWKTTLPAWGNASPVRFGALVCTTSEPDHVVCLNAKTGALAWQAHNNRMSTLPAAQRPAMQARLDAAASLDETIRNGLRDMSQLRRDARRVDDPAPIEAALEALSSELDTLKSEQNALRSWVTPDELGLIGYASATPLTDGTTLYVLTGNGVLGAYDAQGTQRWSVWLGEPVRPMRGYDFGSVSSPQLADGLLIVAHRHLRGLDPSTGRTVWQDEETWDHYGTPGIVRTPKGALVLTPDGRAVRAKDGVTVQRDLGDIYFVGPVSQGDRAYWLGGKGHEGDKATNRGWAWRFTDPAAKPTPIWAASLPEAVRVYTNAVFDGNDLYVLTLRNQLWKMDATTGTLQASLELTDALSAQEVRNGIGYAQPTRVGDHLFLGWEPGVFARIDLGDTPKLGAMWRLPERSRSTPWFEGDHVYVRTLTTLWRFDR